MIISREPEIMVQIEPVQAADFYEDPSPKLSARSAIADVRDSHRKDLK